jgi:hypothetical protein
MDKGEQWKVELKRELRAAGMPLIEASNDLGANKDVRRRS